MKEMEVAMVIARDENENFLAMKKNMEYTDKERYMKNPWETAGGKIEEGETAPEAALRELGEEANISGNYLGPEEYQKEKSKVEHRQQGEEYKEDLLIHFYPVPIEVAGEKPNLVLSKEHSDFEWLEKNEFEDRLPEHNVKGLHRALEVFE